MLFREIIPAVAVTMLRTGLSQDQREDDGAETSAGFFRVNLRKGERTDGGQATGTGLAEWRHSIDVVLVTPWGSTTADRDQGVALDYVRQAIVHLERSSPFRELDAEVDVTGYVMERAGDYIESTVSFDLSAWFLLAREED